MNAVTVGQHHHKHGTSVYVFPCGTTYEQFEKFLGGEFEDDGSGDEWLEIDRQKILDPSETAWSNDSTLAAGASK